MSLCRDVKVTRLNSGDACNGDADEALRLIEKRKPNFMRYGRSKSPGKYINVYC